ncbi:MAG: aromatic ring-hydroxylating dioxygenase subunit alpha [Rhodospirillales bacterium]|nr:aromatic ring-hydroxylating dioxygenase subunit alpha [Rhodospirillales bacterium]
MGMEQPVVPPFDLGTGALHPDPYIMETGKVDLGVYCSDERFEAEKEIFGRVWLNVAETSEIPKPGDWITREVVVRSTSIILVRGKGDQIRAFHNVCSHRGMKLAWDAKGRGGKFSCPYHAWTFDSVGNLLNIPDEGCFKHVDKTESGLTPIRCDTWEGLIFVNLDAQGTQSLGDYLGPLKKRLSKLPFGSYPYTARVGSLIDANWKLAIEAQCEAYHVRALHSRTVSKMLSSTDNPFVHPLDVEYLGAHRMNSVPRNPDFQLSSERLVQAFSFMNAAQMTVADTGAQDKPEQTFAGHPDINRTGSNLWGNDQYILYPHFIFHVSMGGWWLHRFWPLAPNKCYWEAVYHFERPMSLRSQMAVQYSLALNRDTLMEDNLALVQQQQVLLSGAKQASSSASRKRCAGISPRSPRRQSTTCVRWLSPRNNVSLKTPINLWC